MAIQRERVIEAALRLLDEGGIEGVTLRKLAQALDIQAPSLYWHFANKQALIEAMANALLEDVARSVDPNQEWRPILHQVAGELRQALKARRDGARVFAGTYVLADNVLRTGEAMISALARAGADIELATTSAFSVLYYVLGLVTEEQALGDDEGTIAAGKDDLENLAREKYPYVYQAWDVLFTENFDTRFATGLDTLLDGIGVRLNRK